MNINFIYITAGSLDEARQIGRELVHLRLAACVNIIDHMESFYRWNNAIQNDQEVIIIAKTTESLVPKLIEKVKALHSYDCPCIVCLPILSGHQPFLDWIEAEVQSSKL